MSAALVAKIPDVLLVVAVAATVYTGMCMAMLVAAQLSGFAKRIQWPRYLYLTAAMWAMWVVVR